MTFETETEDQPKPKQVVKLGSLKADLRRESEGDWVVIPPELIGDGEGVRLKVRALTYGPYRMAVDDLVQKWGRKYQGKGAPRDVAYEADGELLAKYILLDWDGLDEPFSKGRALELLTDPAFRVLQTAVSYAARSLALVTAEAGEAERKN